MILGARLPSGAPVAEEAYIQAAPISRAWLSSLYFTMPFLAFHRRTAAGRRQLSADTAKPAYAAQRSKLAKFISLRYAVVIFLGLIFLAMKICCKSYVRSDDMRATLSPCGTSQPLGRDMRHDGQRQLRHGQFSLDARTTRRASTRHHFVRFSASHAQPSHTTPRFITVAIFS